MYSAWSILRAMIIVLGIFYSAFLTAAMRDPTEPSAVDKELMKSKKLESAGNFVLEAILISEDSKFAIINNSIVKIGDHIGEQKVKSIDASSVTLVGKKGEIVLYLFEDPIKEPTK